MYRRIYLRAPRRPAAGIIGRRRARASIGHGKGERGEGYRKMEGKAEYPTTQDGKKKIVIVIDDRR